MLEIACFNASSAIAAAEAGADRIELCADYAVGGVTPPHDTFQQIRAESQVPINVMIRPRAGNFMYSDMEFEKMKSDVELFRQYANGLVFGILDDKNQVDEERNRVLVELAAPLPCTFHRAFDQAPDISEAAEKAIKCGFTSILTSGGKANAIQGAENVAMLQRTFGLKISIILGGGIRSGNIDSMKRQTNAIWYHSAAITEPGETVNAEEVRRLQQILKR